jgi:hypothetical protein
MQQIGSVTLRVLVFTAAAITSACVSNRDITGSVSDRSAFADRMQYPVAMNELRPPPSPVEIRAHCWMQFERDPYDLDTKTALVQKCVRERTGRLTGNE